jgi:hypothetical protein
LIEGASRVTRARRRRAPAAQRGAYACRPYPPSPRTRSRAHAEAETLQQRAERKRGRDAPPAYEAAAAAFGRALEAGGLSWEEQQAAAFGQVGR